MHRWLRRRRFGGRRRLRCGASACREASLKSQHAALKDAQPLARVERHDQTDHGHDWNGDHHKDQHLEHHGPRGDSPGQWYSGAFTHESLMAAGPLEALRTGRLSGFVAALRARIFVPLGSGVLDLPAVLEALADARYRSWLMVEQDTSHEPNSAPI